MVLPRRALASLLLVVVTGLTGLTPVTFCSAAEARQERPAATAAPRDQRAADDLSVEEKETFLRRAKIVRTRPIGTGVTGSLRATLSDGTTTHDAQIQGVDINRARFDAGPKTEFNFRDSYRFNIAGYRLARLIGLKNVPISVNRDVGGKPVAMTWWIDDVAMDERQRVERQAAGPGVRFATQVQLMRVWDELIQNRDRNQGNMLCAKDCTWWLIDHTRAFRDGKELLHPDQLTRIGRGFLARLRALNAGSVAAELTKDRALTKVEAAAVVGRRDLLVTHYDDRIRRLGEAAVLFDD